MKTLTVYNQSSNPLGLHDTLQQARRTENMTKAETHNTLSDHTETRANFLPEGEAR
jgi:hypothetical protein